MLDEIKSPSDIKKLDSAELHALAGEIRERIIETVSRNGGHLASNLGMVEATIAIHRVFDSPSDSVIFDVGHQCYAHKLLTGRAGSFGTLRRYGGISGFPSPEESEHDPFYAGHCGAALSSALGLAERNRMEGLDRYVVCVIGDAAFSNGMAFEAMNNCIKKGLKLIILLNDNKMSISKSVGGLSSHLSEMRTSGWYFRIKRAAQILLCSIPVVGVPLRNKTRGAKDRIRRALIGDSIFESLGLDYVGPVNGHNILRLESVLREAKTKTTACVVHILTEKGHGYMPAVREPEKYHSVGVFDPALGIPACESRSFSGEFGDIMCARAEKDKKLCAITAAMCVGTGLDGFIKRFPERFFDVGIEEEHAVAFAGGLGACGLNPVFAVYSTFLQRTYDQIFHDVALQSSHVVFAIDRAGLVPGDGRTHQGIYDCSFLSGIPGMEIYSPDSYDGMKSVFEKLFERRVTAAVRYPRGAEPEYDRSVFTDSPDGSYSSADFGGDGLPLSAVIVTYGRITAEAAEAAAGLSSERSIRIRLIRLTKVYPLDYKELSAYVRGTRVLYLLEEGIKSGGIAEKLSAGLLPLLIDEATEGEVLPHTVIHAIDNRFMPHGDLASLYDSCGFTAERLRDRLGRIL